MKQAQIKESKYYAWCLKQKTQAGQIVTQINALALATYFLNSLRMADVDPSAAPVTPAPVPVPPPAPAPLNNLTADVAGDGTVTVRYKGNVIAQGKPQSGVFDNVIQISKNRINIRATIPTAGLSAILPMFKMPLPPTNLGGAGWPIVADSGSGPAIATYKNASAFSFSVASVDAEVKVFQNHGAPGDEEPGFRWVGVSAAPGRSVTISLCVDDEDLSSFSAAFVAANPQKLSWGNVKPIAMVATNVEKVKDKTLAGQAADAIAFCKSLGKNNPATGKPEGGQGVIYWTFTNVNTLRPGVDIDEYLGCPELINSLRPAGDTLESLAAAHKAAGVPWGICIRPWTWSVINGVWVKTAEGVQTLRDKLKYLASLGATLVYMDSVPMDSFAWIKALQAEFPQILLIPEGGNVAQLAYSAPLRECNAGLRSMPLDVYSKSLQALFHCDGLTDADWQTVNANPGRFVLLVQPHETTVIARLK